MVAVRVKTRKNFPIKLVWRCFSYAMWSFGLMLGFRVLRTIMDGADDDHPHQLIADKRPPARIKYRRPALSRHEISSMPLSQSQYEHLAEVLISGESINGTCRLLLPWQKDTFITSNLMHEFDMTSTDEDAMKLINCGSSRCAIAVTMNNQKVALKVQMYHQDYKPKSFRAGRKDALAMERLTSSPYVATIYANAGASQILEYSSGGNLHDLVKRARNGDSTFRDLTPLTKLKISFQLASAIADLHNIEKNNVASLAHTDVCCHQFILVDGVFKLNDFHMAVFIEKDLVDGQLCKRAPKFAYFLIKLRPPEEIPHKFGHPVTVRLDAVDVYMLGSVLYYLHTNQWIFERKTNLEAAEATYGGERSPIPEDLKESPNRAVAALSDAIAMAWEHDPERRASARDLSNFLRERLKLEGVNVDGVVSVDLPRLPLDHRYSDTDFNNNFNDALLQEEEEETEALHTTTNGTETS